MSYKKHLEDLKRKLAGQHMSLLVGAGFSKNVSSKFPTWDELLFDLTGELYQDEIERDFRLHQLSAFKRERKTKTVFIKERISTILKTEGYLQVVSKFIARKGYGESIATYIEERTPYIKKENGRIFLTSQGVTEELPQEKLRLHRSVIQLPWNNIYTTNYDELLDCCIDQQLIDEFQHKIKLINDEVEALNEEQLTILKSIDELPKSSAESKPVAEPEAGPADEKTVEEKSETKPRNIDQERWTLNHNLSENRRQKEEKEQQSRDLNQSLDKSFRVITYAAGLKLRRNRNIVKLHGSLRSAKERLSNFFEFDGDFKSQYVISKEDYDSYPQKHEAFTQLMRISLLQESFCLVGFSGVDPNFLTWIGWVRDILQKQAARNPNQPDYKIYLIDVFSDPDPSDRKLFFENHSIVRIPVRSPEVLAILSPGKAYEEVDPREAIDLFLNYLASDAELLPYIPLKDLSNDQDRRRIWRQLQLAEPHKRFDLELIKRTVTRLDELKQAIFLPDINHGLTFGQHTVISAAGTQINLYQSNDEELEWLCRLIIHALKDYFVPIYDAVESEVVDVLLRFPSTQSATQKLIERNQNLRGIQQETDIYGEILQLAYSLQFDKLEALLEKWNAKGRHILQKAAFLALFDAKAAQDILEDQLYNNDDLNGEERMYAFELLSYTKLSVNLQRDKKLDKTISHYEHSGFRTLSDNFKYLQDQLAPKKPKLTPYGNDRFSTGKGMRWIKHTEQEMALQYLTLLAESGVQMSLPRVTFQLAEDWYYIFKSGFEIYPFPFLYYALQYGGDNFLKTIGQEYAYSEKLTKQLSAITVALFNSLKICPSNLYRHIIYVLSELLIAAPPSGWQTNFAEFWQQAIRGDFAFPDRNQPEVALFNNGIKYIEDSKIVTAMIADCLARIALGNSSPAIDYLYHLNFNQHYKQLRRGKTLTTALKSAIETLIKTLPGNVDTNLFALGNIYRLLTDDQVAEIKQTLKQEDFQKVKHVRIWHIILFFMSEDKPTVDAIKQAVLQHHALWYTGIEGDKIYGGVESINLASITKDVANTKGVTWSKNEVSQLYQKIAMLLPLINAVADRNDGFITFTDVLEDMLIFLETHRKLLIDQADLESTITLTRKLFYEQRNYESLTQGLLSDDNGPVVTALSEATKELRTFHVDETAINIVVHKAMLQHQPGLEATLSYLASWLDSAKHKTIMRKQEANLVQILQRFLIGLPEDINIPYVLERIVTIALCLKKWKVENPAIDEWITKADNSRFNNLNQLVLKYNSNRQEN